MKKIKYLIIVPALAALLFVFPAAEPAYAGGNFGIGFSFSVPLYDPYPTYYYPSYPSYYYGYDYRPYWRGYYSDHRYYKHRYPRHYYYPRHDRHYGRDHYYDRWDRGYDRW